MSKKRKSDDGSEETDSEKKICVKSDYKDEKEPNSTVTNDDCNEEKNACSSTENNNRIKPEEIRNNLVQVAENIRVACYTYTSADKQNFITQLNEINFIPSFFQFFNDEEINLSFEELTICFSVVVDLISMDNFRVLLKVFTNSNARSLFRVLEYDPLESKPQNHRDFLNRMNFKEAIAFNSPSLTELIRNTKQVSYIFEATLLHQRYARVKAILNDFLNTHKVLIVEQIFLNDSYLNQVLETLSDPAVNDDQRLDVLKFLQELIHMMTENKLGSDPCVHYKVLLNKNIIFGLIVSMETGDISCQKLAATVLCKLAEKAPKDLQDFLNRQTRRIVHGIENGQLTVELLIKCLFNDYLSDITFTLLYFFELIFDPAITTYDYDMFGIVFKDTLDFVQKKIDETKFETVHFFGPLEAAIKLIIFFIQNHSAVLRALNVLSSLVSTTVVLILSGYNLLTAEGLQILKLLIELNDVQVTATLLKYKILKIIVDRFDSQERDNFIKMKIRSVFGVIMQSENFMMRLHYEEAYGNRFAEIKVPGPVFEQREGIKFGAEKSLSPLISHDGQVTRSVMQTNDLKKKAKHRINY